MRIALLGNMNNNFFNLTRYLRDLKHDAHLFVFPNDPTHFHPSADTFTLDFSDFVHYLTWGNPFDLLTTSQETIKKDIAGYDFYIACGTGPAYLAKVNIEVGLFVPYGSDLYSIPFFKLVKPLKLWHYFVFSRQQQKGIRSAKNITLADNSDLFSTALKRIGFNGKRLYSGIPFVYTPQYSPEKIACYYPFSKYYNDFSRIRQHHDLVVFHHSRHCWKNEPDPVSLKDNDKLFRALADCVKTHNKRNIAIITFEYGHDVSASKQLCKELNIEKNVFWFPLMDRRELMIGISQSDIVAGEFRNSWFTYGVVFESMALAKPVMHYRDDKLYEGLELYPMIYAKEVKDILAALLHYYDNKKSLDSIGYSARKWFERNIVEKSMREISNLLTSVA